MDNGLFNENGYKKQIVFGFLIIVVFVVFISIIIVNKKNSYLIVNESSIIMKSTFGYKQIEKFDDDILNGNFNVYNGSMHKNITIKRDSYSWYYFNKNYKDLELNNVSLAYTGNFKGLKVADYDVSYYDDSDDEILNEVLKGEDISNYEKSVIKSSFDLDGDGKLETIYTISDFNLSDSDGSSAFIFLARDGKLVKIIDKDLNNSFLVQNIVDIDGNGKYEVIVSKGTNDVVNFDTCIKMYSINKNNSKCILDCK